jgi:prevent-host-death family protein
MKTVKISEFKAHLSAHLRVASQGEEILVCDRNRPIARLVPAGVLDARAERLMARGILTPPRRPRGEARYRPEPGGDRLVSQKAMAAVWEEERADR